MLKMSRLKIYTFFELTNGEKIEMTIANLNVLGLLPEIVLLTMACLILIIDAYLPKHLRSMTYQLTQGTLIGTAILIMATFPEQRTLAMNDMFVSDPMGAVLKRAVLKLFIVMIVFVAFIYSRNYLRDRHFRLGEYFVLGLIGLVCHFGHDDYGFRP